MFEHERDEYYEAYRGAPGYVFWGLWLLWVIVTFVGFMASQSLSQGVQSLIFAPEPSALRLLSVEGRFFSGGAMQYVSAVIGGLVAGGVLGAFQGAFLFPFLKIAGSLQWLLATVVGCVVRWTAVYAISREFVGLALDYQIVGIFLMVALFVGVAAIAGLAIGIPQSMVLRPRANHSEWWVFANIAAPVAVALVICLCLWGLSENVMRDYTTPIIAVLMGAATGITLIDLLRHPSPQAEWWHLLRWRKGPLQPPPDDTVLGSALYDHRKGEPPQS